MKNITNNTVLNHSILSIGIALGINILSVSTAFAQPPPTAISPDSNEQGQMRMMNPMPDMNAMHDQLENSLNMMNTSLGHAKIDAMSAVLNTIVMQHSMMRKMMQNNMSGMMSGGMGMMSMDPKMKGMQMPDAGSGQQPNPGMMPGMKPGKGMMGMGGGMTDGKGMMGAGGMMGNKDMMAINAKIQKSVTLMNTRIGEQKVTAMADLINDLVSQHNLMQTMMQTMVKKMGSMGKMPMSSQMKGMGMAQSSDGNSSSGTPTKDPSHGMMGGGMMGGGMMGGGMMGGGMMSGMMESDPNLASNVKVMNSSSGYEKIDAMSAVINGLGNQNLMMWRMMFTMTSPMMKGGPGMGMPPMGGTGQ